MKTITNPAGKPAVGLLAVLGTLAFLFSGCPNPIPAIIGIIAASGEDDDGEKAVVDALDLSGLVTAPETDATPVTTPIDQPQYRGTIVWQTSAGSPHTGNFAAGTVYKAVVTLRAKSGYTFAGVNANAFTYSGLNSVTNDAGKGVVTITFNATATYSVSLSETETHTFTAAVEGYGAQSALTVTITNTGTGNTGTLSIALSGTNAACFTLNRNSTSDIAVSGSDTFTIVPNAGLTVGTYSATVTVSGGHGISASFGVSFTVNPSTAIGVTHTYWLNEQGHIAFSNGASATIPAGGQVVIAAQGTGYTGQQWYVGGIEEAGQAGQSSYTFTGAGKGPGKYAVGLQVFKDSAYYYAEFIVTVQ